MDVFRKYVITIIKLIEKTIKIGKKILSYSLRPDFIIIIQDLI